MNCGYKLNYILADKVNRLLCFDILTVETHKMRE